MLVICSCSRDLALEMQHFCPLCRWYTGREVTLHDGNSLDHERTNRHTNAYDQWLHEGSPQEMLDDVEARAHGRFGWVSMGTAVYTGGFAAPAQRAPARPARVPQEELGDAALRGHVQELRALVQSLRLQNEQQDLFLQAALSQVVTLKDELRQQGKTMQAFLDKEDNPPPPPAGPSPLVMDPIPDPPLEPFSPARWLVVEPIPDPPLEPAGPPPLVVEPLPDPPLEAAAPDLPMDGGPEAQQQVLRGWIIQ